MIEGLFLGIRAGRLRRLTFLGYTLLTLFVSVMASALLFAVEDPDLLGGLSGTGIWAISLLSFIFIFVCLYISINITVKRIRDIGLKLWKVVLLYLVYILIVTIVRLSIVSPEASFIIDIVDFAISIGILLFLVLTPTDAFGNRDVTAQPE